MQTPDYQKEVARVCAQIGQLLVMNGAEIPSVEETVEFVGRAAKVEITCYVTLNAVFINLGDGTSSHFVKTPFSDINLQKVDDLNQFAREFDEGKISFETLASQVEQVSEAVIEFPLVYKILGAGFVSVAPMMLFIATWGDLALSFLIGMLGYTISYKVSQHADTPYIKEAFSAFCVAVLASMVTIWGIGDSSNNIILCSLMPLVPGIAITNSIREIIARHIISGMIRAVDALLTAGAIGSGVVIANVFVRLLFNQ